MELYLYKLHKREVFIFLLHFDFYFLVEKRGGIEKGGNNILS